MAAPARAHARSPLEAGIADDGVLLGGGAPAADAVAAWQRLGIDTVRVQVSWSRVTPEPQSATMPPDFHPDNPEDPGYNWAVIDEAVDRLVQAGIRPTLMLDGPPPLWASGSPTSGNQRYEPVASQFAAFATAAAKRYGAAVREYILWNEPNLPLWLQPQASCVQRICTPVSPHVYRYMVRAAYPAIHAADPEATVLIGALAPTGGNLKSRNANMRPLVFLRAFGCVDESLKPLRGGGCAHFAPAMADGFAYHPHSTKNAPDQPYPNPDDAGIASLPKVEHVLDALQAGGRIVGSTKPLGLWLDEYAYQTSPPDKLRGVTPGRQDRFLQQAAYQAWRDPRVQLLAQYLWNDEPVGGGKSYTGWQSGLHSADGQAKLALAHFDDPFWVDFARNTIWGQVRPGGAHHVQVQVRRAGTSTSWEPLAEVDSAEDGSWSVKAALVAFSSYRARSDDGETSATMVATPLASSAVPGPEAPEITPPSTPATGGPVVPSVPVERRTVEAAPGVPVPASFAGFSVEYESVPDYLGSAGALNPVFANLVGALARAGNGAPTLRIGGDSTDRTWWNPDGAPRPAGVTTDLNPAWLGHLAAWQSQTKTPLVLGLNLGINDPSNAAALAQAAQAGLPAGSLTTAEIGNEPDLYASPRTYAVGKRYIVRTQKRGAGYSYPQYRDELDAYVKALKSAAPGLVLSAGGFAAPSWDDMADDLLGHEGFATPVYNAHAYPLQTCDPTVRRTRRKAFVKALLASQAYATVVNRMTQLVAVATAHGAAVRVSELNSAICGGLRGVSDTFASALWGTDILFGLAEAGVRNVDFHTWTGSFYGPVEFVHAGGGVVGKVRPLFYAMLLFDRATPPGSRLVSVGPNPPGTQLKTWSTIDPQGTRRIVVINKDPMRARSVVLQAPGGASVATVERLMAPTANSATGVTFGGMGYGPSTSDGLLRGTPLSERVPGRAGSFTVTMPPASAALVKLPGR